jgi:hypothetical protein
MPFSNYRDNFDAETLAIPVAISTRRQRETPSPS